MSLTTKHTFALSPVSLSIKEIFALLRSTKKLSGRVFLVLFLFLSHYAFSQNPITGNQSFQILSEGNFTSTNSHHIHGPLAVGGNLVINTPSIGEINMDNTGSYIFTGDGSASTGLLVKGAITWTTGALKVNDGNYIHIGNSTGSITSNNGGTGLTQVLPTATSYNNAKRIEASVIQPTNVFQTVGFDFTTLFNTYRSTSTTLGGRTNNVQLYNSSNVAISGNTVSSAQNVRINSLNPGVNYLNLTSTSLNNITELSFATAAVPSASKVLVINVPITTNFVWNNSNMAGIAGTQGPYVIWNFYGGTTYNLTLNTASMVVGTIFAPNMNLIKTGTGDTEGGLIAKTIQLGIGEIHNFQFDSDLSTSDPCTCTGNLLTNNSFENGITGWSSSGGSAYNGTGYQVCGSYNGYLQATTTNAWLWQQVSATVGTTYNLSFWGGTHDPSFNHYVRLAYYNSSNTLLGSNQVNVDYDVDPNNDLAYYSLLGTAPAGTSYMRVEVFANGDYVKLDQMCLSNAATSGLTTCTPPVVTASSNSPVNAGSAINLTSSSMGGNGAQLVTNGDFGSGNNSFSSDYTFGGGYNITTNPQTVWSWAVNCTNANGNMIVGDGNGNANSRFWYQSINVTAGTTYTLSFNAYDFWGGTSAAKLQWGVNGTKTGTILNLSTGGCNTWQQISTTWTATTTGTVVFAIYNNELSAGNNDFAIDDISIKASGPTTYSWSGPLSFTSTTQNPTISSATTSMSGVYTVTSSVGGCTATATTSITINSTFSCAGSCESANLVVNPQFEIDMSGWTASNGQLTRGGGGTYGSFLEVNVGDLTGTYSAYQDVSFGANAPYKFIAYAAKHGVNNLPKMYLEFYNGTTYLSKTADILVSKNYDGTFQTINFEGNTPANTTKIRIVGWTQNNALKFDNVSLVGCQACLTITSPASICVGQSATLTANNCSGTITWNTGATGSSITVNPTTTTTYTATCSNTTNILNNPSFETGNLTAWTNWNYTTITATASERQSGTYGAKVTASAAGGGFAQDNVAVAGESFTMKVWGKVSSATPWSGVGVKFMNASFTSLSDVSTEINATTFQEYTVTNTAPAGTAWVQVYAWTDASTILYLDNFSLVKTSSNTTATATVTVNTAATATATGDTECVGATIVLGSTGGGTYSWTGPASFASTLQNPTRPSATASMAGVYTVTVTSANGCTATATANVVINNGTIPTATVVNTGCTGSTGSITVTNLPDGYSTNINGGAWTQYKNSYVDLAAGTYSIGYQGGGCNTYANFTVATSTDNPLLSLSKTDPTCSTTGSVTVTGSGGTTGLGDATYQLWYGISGNLVSNLTSNANYPNTPSFSTLVGIAEGYNNAVDNVGGRISGYIVPPTTGTYYFWVASDDYSEFWGSGDTNPANKVLLASVSGYTGYREWNKYASQKTVAINLTAGQIYYFEVLYKEGTGGDNISLGWSKPGEATTAPSEVIPGKYLRPNVASSTTTPVYQYKIGSGAFQTSNVFTGLAAGTYTVTIQDAGGCTTTASITLSISGGTTAPTGVGASRCGTGTVAISASGCTGTYNWYAAAAGGTSLGTGATYTTPSISATTTYYVDCTVNSCVSSRTAVTATVTTIPSAPTATGASRCGTGTVTLSASGCAGAYNWYAAPTGGTSLGSAATYTTPSISASTTYYVDCTVSGCTSSRASAVATVNAQPANPAGAGSRCGAGTVVLTGTGCTGTYNWYAAAAGGTSLGSAATYTTPSISATTTYYVDCTVGSCTSNRAAAVATVTPIPTATASSNSPIVVGGTLNLFSTGGTTYSWAGPNGFTSNQQDVSSANLTSLDAGTYTVTANTNGCTAIATTQVVVNNYDPGDIDCSLVSTLNFTSPTLISGTAGANNAQYRFSNVAAGTDAIVTILSRSHTDVEIVDLDIPAVSYGGYDAAFQPMIDYNWINSNGTYDAAGEKSITFKFDFVQSGTTTPKTIPNLLATGLDIDGSTNEVREFIQANNYQSYQIQTPSSLTLSGALKAKGPLTTYAGINELALDAMVSYAYINSSSITVTYGGDWNGSTADFGDTAPGNSDEKRLNSLYFKCYNFNTTVCALPLAAPTATSATRCGTGSVTLSASGCTGTYYWYTASTGGLAVEVGSTFTTPSLSATTNYFVECNAAGCTSTRTAVVATIKPTITISKVLGDSECLNSDINLSVTASGGTNLTYSWSGPSSFVSNLQNPTRTSATVAMAGTYSVTVSNAEGCAATATATVTVSNLPTASITGTTTICNGQSTTLTASGGNYYIWSNGSTSAAITVNPSATTSYSVTVYQNNVTNTSLITNVTSFNALNFSLINATNSYGGPATLFDGVDNLNAETFHASRTTAGADWGVGYNLGGSVLVTNLSIDRRNDCCTDRAEGGVMQVWNNGTMVYQSNVLNNTGDGVLAATPAPNVIGTEVRYVFLAGANTLSGESLLNFTEFIIGGTKLCSTTSTSTVTVNAIPTAPTSAGASRCGAGTVTMTASGCAGGTISWYGALTGGTTLTTGATYTTPSISATTTYYLECSLNGCVSATRNSAVATINTIPTATATGDTECVGSTIILASSGGNTYSWSGPSGFASTLQNPTISNAQTTNAGVYTVTVTSAAGCSATAIANVVVNTIPTAPTSAGASRCGAGTVTMTASGCAGGTITWYGALTGGTALTTGTTYTTPSISATTTYYLECSLNGCVSTTRNSAVATINTIPTASATGNTECVGSTVNLTSSGGNTYSWFGPSGFASTLQNPTLSNAQTTNAGIYTVTVTSAAGCSATATANVVVNTIPSAPTSAGGNRCGAGTVTMTASGCAGGTISWYGALTGGTALTTGTTYTTPSISATTTYYLECSLNGCVSTTRNSAVATVNTIPTASATGDTECVGSTIILASSGGNTYSWSGPSGFTSTLQNPTISNAQTTNAGVYTVTVTSAAGCSATATANVVVNTIPSAPTSAGGNRCGTGTITMTASGCAGGTISWYGALTGGTALTTGATYTTPSISSTTTYYLECSLNGCISTTRNSAVATINTIPTASATGDTECVGSTIILASSSGSTYSWSGPSGFASTLQNPTISNAQTTNAGIYTVTVTSAAGCSATTTANVVVNTIPSAPTSAGGSRCGPGTITMTASGCAGGTISWYGALTGGTALSTGTTYTTPSISSTTTYYLECSLNGCISTTRNSAVATVNSIPTATATGDTECVGSTIILTSSGGNTYSWSGSSGFASTLQNPTISNAQTTNAGVYTVTVTSAAGCSATATANVVVNTIPSAPTSAGGNRCGTGTVTMTASGCAGGTISWYGALTGGTALTTGTTYTTPSISATTTYYLECSLNGCVSTTRNSAVATINTIPTATATGDTECVGSTIILASSGGNTYSWSGPSGFTSTLQNPTLNNAQTTNAGVYTVTVTSAAGCSATATANVVVNTIPSAPTSAGASRCGTGTVTLSASGCAGGTISWYGALTGGVALTTGATYTTPSISSTTTYYLECSLNGCISTTRNSAVATVNTIPTASATGNTECVGSTIILASNGGNTYSWAGPSGFTSTLQNPTISNAQTTNAGVYTVTVTSAAGCSATATANVVVNTIPSAPTSAGGNRCGTGTVTLSASGCAGGTISWYGALTGGTALSTGTTYTTSSISSTTTYYLECSLNGCVSTTRNSAVATVNDIPTATATANSPIMGGTLNLYATGGNTYSWTGPNGFASTLKDVSTAPVTASMIGEYTVTVNLNGCTATATTNVILLTTDPGEINCSLIPTLSFTSPTLITGTAGAVNAQYRFSNVTGGTDAIVTIMSKSHADIDIIDIDIPATTYGGYEAAMQPIIDYNWINGGGSFDAAGEKSVTFKIDFVETGTTTPKVMPNFIASGIDIDGSGQEVREFIEASGHQSHEIQTPTSLTLSGGLKAKGTYATYAGINELALDAVISYGYVGKSSITITYGAEWNGNTSDFGDNLNPTLSDERRLNSLYFKCYDLNTTVCDLPLAAPTGVPASRCGTGTVTLSATGCSGTYNWYAAATGGTAIGTSNSFSTPSISANTTYYVECNAVGCTSTRTSVLATVNAIPVAPTVSSNSICGSGSITLTATGCSGGTISWFTSKTGGTSLGTGTTYTASALTSSAVYFAACTNSSACVSATRNYGVATVNSIPEATLTGIGSLCLGYQPTNSGKLLLTKFKTTDTFSYNIGSTYNSGTASAFAAISTNGEILTGITDPSTSISYTVRIKNAENCIIDRVVTLTNQCSTCPAGYCEPSTVVKTK